MKKFILLPLAAAVALLASCEKPPSDAEKTAQIEKEVQARLAAEHMTEDQKRLAQQQADLDAREKLLADKETASSRATATPQRSRESTRVSSNESNESSAAPRSYDTFYEKLDPYGSWRETDNYGYVFQPREAQSRNWRPYTNGRWAYSDAGWTWVSDEPFGWATYHYGRWTRLSGTGWVWVPGEEWAPAWVSWRKGEQNVGWAPLPPEAHFDRNKGIHKWADNYYDIDAGEYVFIPNEDIGAENIERSVLPQDRNVAIVNETTNVTNITYSNTSIINEGPNYDELRSHSRRPLERMRLQRDSNLDRDGGPRASVNGNVLQMVTPLFAPRAAERPRTAGPALRAAVVEHMSSGNQPDAERARQKMRLEATPPPDAPSKRFQKPTTPPSNVAPASVAAPTAPAATATPVMTPPPARPVATERPTRPEFTPRATPVATAPPVPTTAPVVPTTPPPAAAAESTPIRNQVSQRDAGRAEQLRKQQEAVQKMMEKQNLQRERPATPPVQRQATPPQEPAATPLTNNAQPPPANPNSAESAAPAPNQQQPQRQQRQQQQQQRQRQRPAATPPPNPEQSAKGPNEQ